jgi:NhaC family Na+:H+ antiporter
MEKRPHISWSVLPIIGLIFLLAVNIFLFKEDSVTGPHQLAFLLCSVFASLLAVKFFKVPYKKIEEEALNSVKGSMKSCFILLVIGAIIGLWIVCGTIPSMVYYGVKLINPVWFLPLTCLVCSLVSFLTGSSWITGGTIGVAFVGIGSTMNIPAEICVGAIISGSYFGDKLSPLADTTNLASAFSDSDLFSQIKYSLWTSLPAILITLILFTVIGFQYDVSGADIVELETISSNLFKIFNITPWLLLLPVLLIILAAFKIPTLTTLVIGAIIASVLALFMQADLLAELMGGDLNFISGYKKLIQVTYGGFEVESGNEFIDEILSRGGMSGTLNTVWLIIMGSCFAGVMKAAGFLDHLSELISKIVKGPKSLILATMGTSIATNVTTSDQYLSQVIPGIILKKNFSESNLANENLARATVDSGAATSVLIPWNSCGAYFSSVLDVATISYLPFCFFNLLSPLIGIVFICFNLKIKKRDA